MIKNPKLGQKVFYLDDKGDICAGRISQVYNRPSIGVDNFLYLDKAFVFSTRNRAFKYLQIKDELKYINHQMQSLKKQEEKYTAKLNAFLK